MHLVYMDDAKDDKLVCFSAIIIPEDSWQAALDHLIAMRRAMWATEKIYNRVEIHATEWVGGRGRIAPFFIAKGTRARLFHYMLSCVVLLPGARLLSASFPRNQDDKAFEWMLNRLNVNMGKSGSRAVIISDEGKNYDFLLRRMRRHNFIPSKFGGWAGGGYSKNIMIDRLLEDIVYRDSKRSLFVQMADCCAYSLLRRENPVASKSKYGLDQAWYILSPIMVKAANGRDPYGVIRP